MAQFTDHLARELKALQSREDLNISEQYKLAILEKLDGRYDDVHDFINMQIALNDVAQLVISNIVQLA